MPSSTISEYLSRRGENRSRSPMSIGGAVVLAYVVVYVFLDWLSFIHPLGPYAITVWNPPPGLSLALLLGLGLRYAPALLVACALAEITVRHGHADFGEVVLYAAILAGGYTAIAVILKRSAFDPRFRSLRDLMLFVTVVSAGSIVIAAAYVFAHVATGALAWSEFADHTLYFWVGDVIGIATTTPFLLIHGARAARGIRPRITIEVVLQALSIAAVLGLISTLEPGHAANLFYLLFMPLVWISIRYGFEGATAGLLATQLGLIAAVQLAGYTTDWVLQFQLLMLALTVTGAFLGMSATQWRRARHALESSEAELNTIVATAPDAIVSLDDQCRVTRANRAAEALFGREAVALADTSLSELIVDLPSNLAGTRALRARARRSDASELPVEVSFGSTLVDGRPVYIGVIRDTTDRSRMEEKLRERDQHLDRTLRIAAAAEMASALAHELNQPLTAASAYVQALEMLLARNDPADPSLLDTMHKTAGEVERAGSIVRRLREFYRHDPGTTEQVQVEALVENALAPLRTRIERHGIEVAADIDADVPPLVVDRVQIEMVLHNVVRNAVDALVDAASERRQIVIAASRAQPGGVQIAVEDTGPGVAPAIAEQLFRSFVTSRKEGTGLGLAISRSIVERHGGRLWLDRSTGGARFVMTLPALQEGASRA
ncbi:MAG TPA: ATP-binding protein [Burkholderiales bacterium]|nr:ATP-binding protein [Burkholderiales bacterium]